MKALLRACIQASRTIVSRGWREATVEVLGGLVLGAATALLVILLGHAVFPEVSESGTDMGMRLKVGMDRMRSLSAGLAPRESGVPATSADARDAGYVFLDVDAEYDPASTDKSDAGALAACAALAARFPETYQVARPGAPTAEIVNGRHPVGLDCAASRPLNRYLLAELVKGLRHRGARLVVLDIVLAREEGTVAAEENDALRRVLDAPNPVPVVYAAPVELVWQEENSSHPDVVSVAGESDLPGSISARRAYGGADGIASPNRHTYAAIAFPRPGRTLREYPRCFAVDGSAGLVPSLPLLASRLLVAGSDPVACDSVLDAEPARILFTLPPIPGHMDEALVSHRSERAQRDSDMRAFYSRVYGRCLAANFWRAENGLCGEGSRASGTPFSYYRNKIVVVGTTNPIRRDWHITPLGNMAGAQVVVNAIRSFLQYPHLHEKSLAELIGNKLLIVLACTPAWFVFQLVRYGTQTPTKVGSTGEIARPQRKSGLKRIALLVLWFALALLTVLAITVKMSFRAGPAPSLDVLIGVLAIGAELYVEVAKCMIHGIDNLVGRLPLLRQKTAPG